VSESETGAERSVKRRRWAETKEYMLRSTAKTPYISLSPYEEPDAQREATTRRSTSPTSSHKHQRGHSVRHTPFRQLTPDHRSAPPRWSIDLEHAVKVLIGCSKAIKSLYPDRYLSRLTAY
jgi:hypothetical protein